MQTENITVVGGGAFGVALGNLLCDAGRSICIWARDEITVYERISKFTITDTKFNVTRDILEATSASEMLVLAVPSHAVRTTLMKFRQHITRKIPILIASKGMDRESGKLISEVVEELCPGWPIGVIAGPNLASEVMKGLPTTITIATQILDSDCKPFRSLMLALNSAILRTELSNDIIGIQACGAIKNVLSIGCGVCAGIYKSENADASMIGLAAREMKQFVSAIGGNPDTVFLFGGIADLVLSSSSPTARNFNFGRNLVHNQKNTRLGRLA